MHELIKKYPRVDPLRNWLIAAYQLTGEVDKAKATAEWLVKNRKKYFFGYTKLAPIHIIEGNLTRAGELLGGEFKHLHAIAPGREIFHISEIESFFHTLGIYHCYSEDYAAAKECLAILKQHLGKCHGYKNLKVNLSLRGRLFIKLSRKMGFIQKSRVEQSRLTQVENIAKGDSGTPEGIALLLQLTDLLGIAGSLERL